MSVNPNLKVFLGGDGAQIEVRMMAIASGDPLLIQQFNSAEDIHSLVGAELTGWSVAKIKEDKATRKSTKEFHFSILFGVGKEHGAEHLQAKGVKITKAQFAQFHTRYFQRYRGVARFIDKCHQDAEEKGYVDTIFGFRRRVPKNDDRRGSYYLNQAINSPIQGAAHQLILIAMALLRLKPVTYRLLQVPVMEVHDELVFLVRLGDLVEADQRLRFLLQEDVPAYCAKYFKQKFPIPIVAETEAGFTRGTMVKYEESTGIPSVEQFLVDWRKKYREVSERPLTKLLELDSLRPA